MKVILGSGITGVVAAMYFRNFSLVTKGRGQEISPFAPKILRRTDDVDSFLDHFVHNPRGYDGLVPSLEPRVYRCGYQIGGDIVDSIPAEMKEAYLKKTRGEEWRHFEASGMNDGETEVEGYNMVELYNYLYGSYPIRTRRLFVLIQRIDTDVRTIIGVNPSHRFIHLSLIYDRVLNTLPLPFFHYLIDRDHGSPQNNAIHLVKVSCEELWKIMSKLKLDFIYFPEEDVPYDRATYIPEDNVVCFESRQPIQPEKHIPYNTSLIQAIMLPYGKITEQVERKSVEEVTHIGRYAENDNDMRLHDMIGRLERREYDIK